MFLNQGMFRTSIAIFIVIMTSGRIDGGFDTISKKETYRKSIHVVFNFRSHWKRFIPKVPEASPQLLIHAIPENGEKLVELHLHRVSMTNSKYLSYTSF